MKKIIALLAFATFVVAEEPKGPKHPRGDRPPLTEEQRAERKKAHEELLKKYDENKDGKLDKEERKKISAEDRKKLGPPGRPPKNRE